MHATQKKFGYPETLLHETEHWCVLLRPQQVTLAALVLCATADVTAMGGLGREAWADMASVTLRIERALHLFRPYDKINYLALMMVDPHVHFHVLPRYSSPQMFAGADFTDPGWPGVPDLKSATTLAEQSRVQLHADVLNAFRRAG